MTFRALLPTLGLLCLFCSSSARAQTLDNTLLTETVVWNPSSLWPKPVVYSITSVGLPYGLFDEPSWCVSDSSGCIVKTTGPCWVAGCVFVYSPTPYCSSVCTSFGGNFEAWLFDGETGPITAFGTYGLSGTVRHTAETGLGYLDVTVPTGGEIIVAPAPEPFSGSLMAIGFAALALRRYIGRKHSR